MVAAGFAHGLAIAGDPNQEFGLLLATDSAAKPGSNTWTIWSDRRLKKNIRPLSGALDRVLGLHGVTFEWLDPASAGGRRGIETGLIADEVERVFPQWVGRDPKGFKTLTVAGFEALTAEALRELRQEKDSQMSHQQARIEALQTDNAELRAHNEKLNKRVDALEGLVEQLLAERAGGDQ
jgi:hypothetical protein